MDEKREAYELGNLESLKSDISQIKGVIKALLKWQILMMLRNNDSIYAEDILKTYFKLRPYYAKAQEELLQEGRIWIDKTGQLMLIGEDEKE
jgi:hypothetical protein